MTTGEYEKPAIKVFAKDMHVGDLTFVEPKVCHFQYTPFWITNGYPISPYLPLEGEINSASVINFLRNLFPEGGAFETLLETKNLSKNNIYGILKTIGSDTAGILTFTDDKSISEETNLREVTPEELTRRLDQGLDITSWDNKYRLSLAGVQNKLNVYLDEKSTLYLADGKYASTHILKFASPSFPTVVANELFCMRLANAMGLPVPEVSVRQFGEHSALLVKRFDRRYNKLGVDKRHMIDGCQALDLPPEFKYERNFGDGTDVAHIRDGASFKGLFAFSATTAVPAATRQNLIDWMVFNLLVGNSDAHSKNISFYVSESGDLTLTPFYDLVSVVFEASNMERMNTTLAMAIGDNFDIEAISAFDLLTLADEVGIKFEFLKRRIDKLTSICRNLVHRLDFSEEQLNQKQIETIQSLSALIDGRCEKILEQSRQFKAVIATAF